MGRYPTKTQLDTVEHWDTTKQSPLKFVEYLRTIWEYADWGFKTRGKKVIYLELHTGGWSGNEEIICALKKNYIFWGLYWEKHLRGGHFYFKIYDLPKGEK